MSFISIRFTRISHSIAYARRVFFILMRSIFVCVSTYSVECELVSTLSAPHYTSVHFFYALRPDQVLLILTSEVYFLSFLCCCRPMNITTLCVQFNDFQAHNFQCMMHEGNKIIFLCFKSLHALIVISEQFSVVSLAKTICIKLD